MNITYIVEKDDEFYFYNGAACKDNLIKVAKNINLVSVSRKGWLTFESEPGIIVRLNIDKIQSYSCSNGNIIIKVMNDPNPIILDSSYEMQLLEAI